MAERTIVLDGFSKTYAMTGWRLGYAHRARGARRAVQPPDHQHRQRAPRRSRRSAAVEALTGPQDAVEAMVEEFRARRDAGRRRPQRASRRHVPDAARRVLRLPGRHRRPGMTGAELAERLLLDAGVSVLAGTAFGERRRRTTSGSSYANSQANIARALERMATLLSGVPRRVTRRPAAGPRHAAHPRGGPAHRCARRATVDVWEDELPPPRGRAAPTRRGHRRAAGAADRPGGRRAARRRRAAAQGGRPTSRWATTTSTSPACTRRGVAGRQHARRADGDDRRPGLRAADGGRAALPEARRLRARGPLADLGAAAAAGQGRPWRDARASSASGGSGSEVARRARGLRHAGRSTTTGRRAPTRRSNRSCGDARVAGRAARARATS